MAQPVVEALKVALADTFTFYLKAHYFHWNVQGRDFKQYHDLFGGIWEEVFGAVDPLAEFIRTMGSYAPGTLGRFKELTTLVELETVPESLEMVLALAVDNAKVLQSIKTAFSEAEKAGALAVANFLQDRMAAHEKHGWFLHSTLGNNVND
jgi:starvation-inducible DNA-binding protein